MRLRRALAAAAVVVAAAAVAAGAEEQPVLGEGGGWYSSLSIRQGDLVADPVAVNTLQQGDYPVGAFGTTEHKRSYLLLGLPDGAVSATITLQRSDSSLSNFGAPGPILACPLPGPFTVTTANPLDEAPEVDCDTVHAVGVLPELEAGVSDIDGDYTFDLTPLLDYWAAEEDRETAIALVADVSLPQPLYQVTFRVDPFNQVGTAVTVAATAADDGVVAPVAPQAPTSGPAPAAGAGLGSTTTAPGIAAAPPQAADAPAPAVAAPSDDGAEQLLGGGPPVDLDPLPVNPAAWLLLPVGLGTLVASGRRLSAAGDPATALDGLLRR